MTFLYIGLLAIVFVTHGRTRQVRITAATRPVTLLMQAGIGNVVLPPPRLLAVPHKSGAAVATLIAVRMVHVMGRRHKALPLA